MTPDQIYPHKETYNNQIKDLRKQWAAEYKAEQQRIIEERAAHVKRMILQKAMNLREKKAIAVKKAEAQRVLHAKIRLNYEAHVARLTVLENQKNELRKQRFSRLVEMLSAESKYWITTENINQKITVDLFLKPATTGVITGVSEHWRYHCPSMQPNRVMQQLLERSDDDSESDDSESDAEHIDESRHFLSAVDYLAASEPYITKQKENIRSMLNSMIGTGDDRNKYDDMVKDFIELSETYNGPMTNLGQAGTFASDEPPNIDKLSKNDFTQFFSDPDDPVLTAQMKSEVNRVWSNKMALKDDNLSEDEIAYRAQNQSKSSLSRMPDAPDDSSEEIPDDEDEIEIPVDGAESTDKQEKFAVAESLTIDDLIEDVDYVDENNTTEVRKLYEKIRMKSFEIN